MNSRERFRKAIRHEQPDRVPIDCGQDFHNGLHEIAYANLLKHLVETGAIHRYDKCSIWRWSRKACWSGCMWTWIKHL